MSQPRSHVVLVFVKELRETIRDRRTLAVMILFPLVVYPLLSLLTTQILALRESKQEARASRVAVAGEGPSFDDARRAIGMRTSMFALQPGGSENDVDRGTLDALVRGRAARTLEIVFDSTRDESRKAEDRLADLLATLATPAGAATFDVARHDVAAAGPKLGGYLVSKVLPLIIVLMVLLGAFYPAIDVTAGERERGTLETILSSPIAKRDLLLGKVLAVTLLASLTGALNLFSMSLTILQIMRLSEAAHALPVPWLRVAATSLVIVPSAFLAACVFVALGSLARGFKEAQNFLMPVYFLFLLPTTAAALGDIPLAGIALVVPGMNVALLAREIALGHAAVASALIVVAVTLAYAGAALALSARLYNSERFFDGAPPPAPGKTPLKNHPPTAGDALALFSVGYLLLYFLFLPLQRTSLAAGLLAGQWLGLFGLVLIYARLTGRSVSTVLPLRLSSPSGRTLAGAAMLGAAAWIAVAFLAEWLFPPPKEVLEQLRRTLIPQDGSRALLTTLLITALTPAICEEAFFRGPILRGLAARLPGPSALVLSGLLFGLFHMDVWRLLPTSLLGIMLSWIAWRTGSLLPAMLAHGINNAVLVVLAHFNADRMIDAWRWPAQTGLLALSLVGVAAGAWLITKSPNLKPGGP